MLAPDIFSELKFSFEGWQDGSVTVLAAKPGGPSLVLGTHVVEGENTFLKQPSDFHIRDRTLHSNNNNCCYYF